MPHNNELALLLSEVHHRNVSAKFVSEICHRKSSLKAGLSPSPQTPRTFYLWHFPVCLSYELDNLLQSTHVGQRSNKNQ